MTKRCEIKAKLAMRLGHIALRFSAQIETLALEPYRLKSFANQLGKA